MSYLRIGSLRLTGTVVLMLAMMMSVLTSVMPAAAQTGDDTEAGVSGVSGSTYVSPDFGYSLEWDRTWEVRDERVETDYNMLRLDDDGSILYIEGYGDGLPVDDCLETYGVAYIESSDGVSNVEAANPEEGADGSLSVELTFRLTFDDDESGEPVETEFAGFIACYEINDGAANLVITHLGLTDLWEDETDARDDLLSTLSLDGTVPADDVDPTETPDDSDTPPTNSAVVMGPVQGDGELPDNADQLLDLFQTSITDINDYWEREYPLISGGKEYRAPTEFIPWVGEINTPCGPAVSFDLEAETFGNGPFFCPLDDAIYIDMGFANFQFDQVGNVPFLIPVVMAHEVGHHVQHILGMEVCYQTPCLDPNVLTSQEIEYMADCYAGSWSRDAELRGRLGAQDIEANIIQYVIILGGGEEGADPGGHGRGSERIWWFLNGFVEGANTCYESSDVTSTWAQSGPPDDIVAPTAVPDQNPTEEATEEAGPDPTVASSDLSALGDSVETGDGTFSATSVVVQDAVENREADGEFVVVFADTFPSADGDGLPFDYEAWTLVDADGNVFEIDLRATDLLLSSAYENGTDELLIADSGYGIALVFDVEPGSDGLILVNESAEIQIDLDL